MIVTVAQEKGGVGKTATAKNLAAVAARGGERVLVIDADPQFALTRQLGLRTGELPVSLVDVLTGARVEAADAIVRGVRSLDVLPSARSCAPSNSRWRARWAARRSCAPRWSRSANATS